jgi:hypothetical protein
MLLLFVLPLGLSDRTWWAGSRYSLRRPEAAAGRDGRRLLYRQHT